MKPTSFWCEGPLDQVRRKLRGILLSVSLVMFLAANAMAQNLDKSLRMESADRLAEQAKEKGDASRGAILFYQPFMACRKCHHKDVQAGRVGPDLAKWEKPATDSELVEALLHPSKNIRKGYESLRVLTAEGKIVVGLIVENDAQIVLRDPSLPGKLYRFAREDLDEISINKASVMPEGLVNQLGGKQQFLDLLKYLMTIRDGGIEKARELEPAPHLYAARPLPQYEQEIDHAGMIADLGKENFRRGQAIYDRVCANCHGTHTKPGSLPTALQFAAGQFKSGSDPYAMYQTITRGFGLMQPQAWMVPQQKYDVVHFIREAYLKKNNPKQYSLVTPQWLAELPKGNTRGPEPQALQPWLTMDYGHSLINTYEIGSDGSNFAYKGIAVRLDSGSGGVSRGSHWAIFDHDTMRLAAVWQGNQFINWQGIHFDGRHNAHPRIEGALQLENRTGPGWADPANSSWEDPRLRGRDGRAYGPLPRQWAHYKGLYRRGEQAVISYHVGDTPVLESPILLTESPQPVYARRLLVDPHDRPLTVQVAQVTGGQMQSVDGDSQAVKLATGPSSEAPAEDRKLAFDGRSFAQLDQANEFDMTRHDFTIMVRFKTKSGGALFAKTESGDKWVPDGKVLFVRDGRLCYDIGWVGAVQSKSQVADGKWHRAALTWEQDSGTATLFVDGKQDSAKELRPKQHAEGQVVRVGFAAPDFPRPKSFFKGDIQWLEFYNEVVNPDQRMTENAPKPIARWKPQAANGNRLADDVGNGHDAKIARGIPARKNTSNLVAGFRGEINHADWSCEKGTLRLTLPANKQQVDFMLWFASVDSKDAVAAVLGAVQAIPDEPLDLDQLKEGGQPRHQEVISVPPIVGKDDGPFAVDVLSHPEVNPWLARTRFTGFDFFPDGDTAIVSAWDGDVWKVEGVDKLDGPLRWQRIATGLFQPLGVRIVDNQIYVTCRDQLVILRDFNGDGEIDWYESFNNDHQVTDHFHEFAMGLQTDQEGNFYYAKSARHALPALVPHHGTLLRITKDGKRTDIIANGFRAANGVCINPDGSFIVTDQEGHWTPKNRINWVRPGGFYGNFMGYHNVSDSSDAAMQMPLCWITNAFDRSPSEPLWVPAGRFGALSGSLLNLSYGYGKAHVIMSEEIQGQRQGGLCELPLPIFPTGLIRGRFHPINGDLYVCGMVAWASSQPQAGGFYRIRHTGKPMHMPKQIHATKQGLELVFTDPLNRSQAQDPKNYRIKAWDLKRTAGYGSKHFNEQVWPVKSARLSSDGKRVILSVPNIKPTWGMEVHCFLTTPDGREIKRRIHNTIYHLAD